MPYEDEYKMWLEKMLIEMNPDWICDGMHDAEFTHDWCYKYCGKDDLYITPKCLHMYYHHIPMADRKTEPSRSEKPNNCDKDINVRSKDCETCNWGEWYRNGRDITNMDDECGGCCSWNSKWTPKTEPQTERSE